MAIYYASSQCWALSLSVGQQSEVDERKSMGRPFLTVLAVLEATGYCTPLLSLIDKAYIQYSTVQYSTVL